MPGIARRPATMWSRSWMYSRRISCTHCLRTLQRATAAFCAIDVGFEVDWLCNFAIALTAAREQAHNPCRHPVMA